MKRCIHCLAEKPDSSFNREHVLPEAFGTFEGNLVLCRSGAEASSAAPGAQGQAAAG